MITFNDQMILKMQYRVNELEAALADLIEEHRHFQIDEDLLKYELVLENGNHITSKRQKAVKFS